jgi:hypothetical protein
MTISDHDRKILWGSSGLRCAICNRRLVVEATATDRDSIVGEECHIVARSPGGPRAGHLPPEEVDCHTNLILLCRNDHRMVDDQPGTYTSDVLRAKKAEHEAWVAQRLNKEEVEAEAEAMIDASHPLDEPHQPGSTVITQAFPREEFLPSDVDDDDLFHWRLSDAFPGSRGIAVIDDPVAAADRLDIVLRHPIEQKRRQADGFVYFSHPFYWFRGSSNMHLHAYSRLGPDRVLFGYDELRLSRVVAFRPPHTMRNFLYIEARADQPSGAYRYGDGEIDAALAQRLHDPLMGYYVDEEYGLWHGHPITRTEYDDAAAIIDGRPQRTSGADLRVRYLTPYNMILCSRKHVINQNRLDRPIGEMMDGILIGTVTIQELCEAIRSIPIPSQYQLG